MTIGNVKEVQLSKMSKQMKHKRLSNGDFKSGCKVNSHRSSSASNNNSDDDVDIDNDSDSDNDSNDSVRSRNSLIDDEAFEKSNDEESIVSTDSNEIIDHGESIESSFSTNGDSSNDTYERTSFLCSDNSGIESLLSDSEDELIRKPPNRRRVQLLSDSSSDGDNAAKTEINSKSNASNHIKIISDKQLSLKTVEKKYSHNESDMKCERWSDKYDKLEPKLHLSDKAKNVNSEFLFDSSEEKLEIRIHIPPKMTKNSKCRKRKRNQVSDDSTDAIKPPPSPAPSSVISNTPSTSTTSSISLLRKRIKEKYRNENLRNKGKFRISNVPKHQSRNQMLFRVLLMSSKTGDKGVDVARAGRGVWLVKVPKYIANRWDKTPSTLEAGKLKIIKQPGQKAQVSLSLSEGVLCLKEADEDDIPKEHRLDITPVTHQSLGVFSHTNFNSDDTGIDYEKLSMEGKIVQKLECHPYADEVYMNLKVKSIKKASIPQRQVKQLNRVVTNYKPVSYHKESLDGANSRKAEGKKSRDDKDAVMEILFSAFEKHQYYNIRDLVKITNQPIVYLKEILKDVCSYNLKNPHKNMWELKPEYRHYKEKSPEPNTVAEDCDDDNDNLMDVDA